MEPLDVEYWDGSDAPMHSICDMGNLRMDKTDQDSNVYQLEVNARLTSSLQHRDSLESPTGMETAIKQPESGEQDLNSPIKPMKIRTSDSKDSPRKRQKAKSVSDANVNFDLTSEKRVGSSPGRRGKSPSRKGVGEGKTITGRTVEAGRNDGGAISMLTSPTREFLPTMHSSGQDGVDTAFRPSLLDEVLTEKKMALLKSPEVKRFLQQQQARLATEKKSCVDQSDQISTPSTENQSDHISTPSTTIQSDQLSTPSTRNQSDQISTPSTRNQSDQLSTPSTRNQSDQLSTLSTRNQSDQLSTLFTRNQSEHLDMITPR